METRDSRQNRTELSMPSELPSKQQEIVILLGKLAIRRQAPVGATDLRVYSKDLLNQGLEDIAAACDNLAMEERQEGQTAFPSIALMLAEVGHVARKRRIAAAKVDLDMKLKAAEQDRRDHPENYVPIRDIWAEVKEKLVPKFGASRTEAK